MTRYVYGGGGAAQVVSLTGVPQTSAATVYNARTGGSVVTDILNISGGALAGVVTPDSFGQALFQGPDAFTGTLWLDFGSGPRWGVNTIDLDSAITIKRAALAAAEKASPSGTTAKNALPYTSNTIGADQMAALDDRLLPKFASAAARNAAYVTPSDGDRVRRTDTHLVEAYNGALSRWVPDYTLISEVVLANSTTPSVTFSSLPTVFKHLQVVYSGKATSGGGTASAVFQGVRMRFNGDTTAGNYHFADSFRRSKKTIATGAQSYEVLEDGTGGFTAIAGATTTGGIQAGSDGAAGVTQWPVNNPAITVGYVPGYNCASSARGGGTITIPDYNLAAQHGVSYVTGWAVSDGTTAYAAGGHGGGGWTGTSAISSITFYLLNSNLFTSGFTISLYGWG